MRFNSRRCLFWILSTYLTTYMGECDKTPKISSQDFQYRRFHLYLAQNQPITMNQLRLFISARRMYIVQSNIFEDRTNCGEKFTNINIKWQNSAECMSNNLSKLNDGKWIKIPATATQSLARESVRWCYLYSVYNFTTVWSADWAYVGHKINQSFSIYRLEMSDLISAAPFSDQISSSQIYKFENR